VPFGTKDCKLIMGDGVVHQYAPLCCWENCPFVHWSAYSTNILKRKGWETYSKGCWARHHEKGTTKKDVCQLRAACYGSKE
jgi:hypothetical protein